MDNVKAARKNMGRCIVSERWKYSAWKWGHHREQLVDLHQDPGEMVNLAQTSRYQGELNRMRSRLHQWCRDTRDGFQVPGHEILSPGAQR